MSGANRFGFWVAVLTAAVAGVFAVTAVLTPARSGPFCQTSCVPAPYVNVAQFIPGDYLWLIPGLLLAPIFVALVAVIHACADVKARVFSRIAMTFAVIYAVVITINCFVQFTVVWPSLQSGETQSLSLFTQYNPHGFFIALEVLAYLAMSAAFVAAAPVFDRGRLELSVRWLFAVSFVASTAAVVGLWLVGKDLIALEVTVLMINWVVLIVGGGLLSVVFRRRAHA